jgi:hypothetical protein
MKEELYEDPSELWKNELHIYRNPPKEELQILFQKTIFKMDLYKFSNIIDQMYRNFLLPHIVGNSNASGY